MNLYMRYKNIWKNWNRRREKQKMKVINFHKNYKVK